MSENYKYKLTYTCDDTTINYEFSAEINIETLVRELSCFLMACSWTEDQVKDILNSEYLY